ncbi:MAG: hypothetical protein L0Z53_01860 [Acidobacteriales bacterium]|nr:hypothetical protein [Terriglobales bacterium]
MSGQRGKAHSPHLSTQVRDFSGLCWGKITPTDFDAFIDFGDQLHVYIESKLPDVDLPHGQKLALQRAVDAASESGIRKSIGIICVHENREGEIDFANCIVSEYRWRGVWRTTKEIITVKKAVDTLLSKCGLKYR